MIVRRRRTLAAVSVRMMVLVGAYVTRFASLETRGRRVFEIVSALT
jgi:hypothetical protein